MLAPISQQQASIVTIPAPPIAPSGPQDFAANSPKSADSVLSPVNVDRAKIGAFFAQSNVDALILCFEKGLLQRRNEMFWILALLRILEDASFAGDSNFGKRQSFLAKFEPSNLAKSMMSQVRADPRRMFGRKGFWCYVHDFGMDAQVFREALLRELHVLLSADASFALPVQDCALAAACKYVITGKLIDGIDPQVYMALAMSLFFAEWRNASAIFSITQHDEFEFVRAMIMGAEQHLATQTLRELAVENSNIIPNDEA